MKKTVSVLIVLSMATMASAVNLATDSFNYANGSALGTNAPWQNPVAGTPTISVVNTLSPSSSLSYPGIPSVGGSIQLNNSSSDTDITPISANSGTVFYSMVLDFNTAFASTNTNQSYFAGFDDNALTSGTFDTGASLVAKKDSDPSKIDIGIAAAAKSPGNNNTKKYSPTAYSTSDPLFVVASYTFNPNAKDDVVNLYIFDSANGNVVPTSLPATPSATSTTAVGNADYAAITRFYLRNNPGETPTIFADDLRIGTSWADILPLAGDANLDGKINADDYALLDRGYARSQSGSIAPGTAQWADGDFNGDHIVNSSDYLLVDQALLAQGGTLSPSLLAEREVEFGPGYVSALTAVPEPASLGLIGFGLISLLNRRKQ